MTLPAKEIKVTRPQCGTVYKDWYRPSINLRLDHFDENCPEEATTSTCPSCRYGVSHGVLIVREDGVREAGSGENK